MQCALSTHQPGTFPMPTRTGIRGTRPSFCGRNGKKTKDLFDEPLKLGKFGTKDHKLYKVKQIELELYQAAVENNLRKSERGGKPRSYEEMQSETTSENARPDRTASAKKEGDAMADADEGGGANIVTAETEVTDFTTRHRRRQTVNHV